METKKKPKLKKIIKIAILALLAIFVIAGLVNPLAITNISLESNKIDSPIKIALISDLHSCWYGKNQRVLIEAVKEANPDIVCLVGDIFDHVITDRKSELFIAGISKDYPVYYVTGNHEYSCGDEEFEERMELLEKYGVVRLDNEAKEIEINGQTINIIGVNDPSSKQFILSAAREANKDYYSVLLSHRPEFFENYAETGVDLVLCGHAHGGQWRIPYLLEQGLAAPNQGLFPKYTSGVFTKRSTTMVVSRGLARESTAVPRFYNRPEIVLINLE